MSILVLVERGRGGRGGWFGMVCCVMLCCAMDEVGGEEGVGLGD